MTGTGGQGGEAPLRVLADENMPGVEACCAHLRQGDGASVAMEIRRLPGRTLTAADVADADVLLVRSVTRVDAALLAAGRVRFVGTATIGTDHLDLDWLAQAGIAWSSAPGCNARAVGEWVLATVLRRAAAEGVALAGRTLGIVGLGHVGREVARLARIVGLRVLACDPFLASTDLPADLAGVPLLALDALLAEADIVSVHVPLTRGGEHPTFHLFDAAMLARLRPGAWLVNAARGEVIDNRALLACLSSPGPDRPVAMLDVWEGEPLPDAALMALVAQASPHIAGHSLEGKWRGTWQIVAAAARHLGLRFEVPLVDLLPPEGACSLELPPAAGAAGPATPEQRLAHLLSGVIDLAGDDARLRAVRVADAPAAGFDGLRKAYPVRREFPAHRVHGEAGKFADDPLRSVLISLGFCC